MCVKHHFIFRATLPSWVWLGSHQITFKTFWHNLPVLRKDNNLITRLSLRAGIRQKWWACTWSQQSHQPRNFCLDLFHLKQNTQTSKMHTNNSHIGNTTHWLFRYRTSLTVFPYHREKVKKCSERWTAFSKKCQSHGEDVVLWRTYSSSKSKSYCHCLYQPGADLTFETFLKGKCPSLSHLHLKPPQN